ncbi:glutathione S-transferase-like protein [Mycena crocata]|nr:glutathione S-transferase-like protein [Mycena crocata]
MNELKSNTPKITLHWLEQSRLQRIIWLLEELNLPYEIKTYKRDPESKFTLPELQAIHPPGKSPTLTIGEHTLAESAVIVEYPLTLTPTKRKDGREGAIGGGTAGIGSLMSLLLSLLLAKSPMVCCLFLYYSHAPHSPHRQPLNPRPSSSAPSPPRSRAISAGLLDPNFVIHPYLCGANLTGAEIMMSFPVIVFASGVLECEVPFTKTSHPRLFEYAELLQESTSYKRAVDNIVALEGEYTLI